MVGRGGAKMVLPFRPALAGDKVMHGGDPVAMVVAETTAQAMDAADLVQVDYEELPAVVDLDTAMNGDDPALRRRARQCLRRLAGSGAERATTSARSTDIIANAAHVAKVSVTNQRMVVASMETRGATGVYDQRGRQLHAARLFAGRRHLARRGRLRDGRAERQSCASSPRMSAAPSA